VNGVANQDRAELPFAAVVSGKEFNFAIEPANNKYQR